MRPIDAAVEVADDRFHWVAVIRRQTTNGRYGSEKQAVIKDCSPAINRNSSTPVTR